MTKAADSLVSAVEDKNAPRRRQASTSTSSRIVLKFSVCSCSGDGWDPALGYILMDSAKRTDTRFEVEGPSTAVMYTSGVSAGASVSIVVVAPADNFPQTLRVEALSLTNSPETILSLASLNLTFDEDIQSEETRTADLCTNSGAGSGDGCAHVESADGGFAVHPVTSESGSWGTLGVGLDQELHPNLVEYVLIDLRAANLSWVLRAVTSSLPWWNQLSFLMVLGPSLQVR